MTDIKLSAIVPNKKGLHARAAAQIVSLSTEYNCESFLIHKDKTAPSKSLIKLLTLDAPKGSELIIKSSGLESHTAAHAIQDLIQQGFGE